MQILNTAGMAIILFSLLFILQNQRKLWSDYALIGLNVLGLIYLGADMYVWDHEYGGIYLLNILTYFFSWPLYYLHASNLIKKVQKPTFYEILAFLPALFATMWLFGEYYWWHSFDLAYLQNWYAHPTTGYTVLYLVNIGVFLPLFFQHHKRLVQFEKQVGQD
ncbi:MAG: hypothetical protein AAGI38_22760, partial [Bacteroidota bacterium]